MPVRAADFHFLIDWITTRDDRYDYIVHAILGERWLALDPKSKSLNLEDALGNYRNYIIGYRGHLHYRP